MSNITENPTVQLATNAIEYALLRIRESPEIGYYAGHGTELFHRLTEAYAELTGQTQREVKTQYAPRNPRNPAA